MADQDTQAPIDPSNVGAQPVTPQPQGQSLDQPPSPAAPPSAPPPDPKRPWAAILEGALNGLSGVSQTRGRGGFGLGLAQGAQGEIAGQQRKLANNAQQQSLKFESARAAAELANASRTAQLMTQQGEETRVRMVKEEQEGNDFADSRGYPRPFTQITGDSEADMSAKAQGSLNTAAQRNGGQIGMAAYTQNPHTADDPMHTISARSFLPTDVSDNPSGVLNAVNDYQLANGQRPYQTIQDAMTAYRAKNPNSPASSLVSDANAGMASMLAPMLPSEDAQKNKATIQQLQDSLDNAKSYSKQFPEFGDVATRMQSRLDNFKSNADTVEQTSNLTADQAHTITAAAPGVYSQSRVKQATKFLADTEAQKAREAAATPTTAFKGQEALMNFGQNPETGEKLTLQNAPDSMLYSERTGGPVPLKMQSAIKPTQQEINRGDFATSTLHILDTIDKLRQQGKVPNGPIAGQTAKTLAAAGLGGDSQEALNLIQFGSTAATGAHVAGRFNVEVMNKMDKLLSVNMNDAQFSSAEKGIRDVMEPYAQQGGRLTVGEARQMQQGGASTPTTHVPGGPAQGLTEGQTGKGSDGKVYVVKGGKWAAQ